MAWCARLESVLGASPRGSNPASSAIRRLGYSYVVTSLGDVVGFGEVLRGNNSRKLGAHVAAPSGSLQHSTVWWAHD